MILGKEARVLMRDPEWHSLARRMLDDYILYYGLEDKEDDDAREQRGNEGDTSEGGEDG